MLPAVASDQVPSSSGTRVQVLHAVSAREAGSSRSRAGALPVGHLCAVKARVALALGIGAGLDRDGLTALLADPEG